MRATIPYVEQKFREYNQLIFGNRLPEVPILLSRATTFVGKCEHRQRRTLLGCSKPYDFCLRFSILFDLTPNDLDDVIIHEMIHLHIAYHRLRDTAPHGALFRQMMDNINRTFGRHITISDRLTSEQAAAINSQRRTTHVIAAIRLTDGRPGVKVLPRIQERIAHYRQCMLARPEINTIHLYLSDDPFFNRYPNSSTLTVYGIKEEELTEHLEKALPLKI